MQFIRRLVVGCLATTAGFIAFFLVVYGSAAVLLRLIGPPDDGTATMLGVLGFIAGAAVGVTVGWKVLRAIGRVFGVKSDRDLIAEWLQPRLEAGEVIRAVLAGAVVHDAPEWAAIVPVLGNEAGIVTASEFLDSIYSLGLTDRRVWLVRKRPFHEAESRAYPIGDVALSAFDLGHSAVKMTLRPGRDQELKLAFNYVLNGPMKRDAETVGKILRRPGT